MTKHAEDLAKLGWQYFECPACGSEGARAFPKPAQQEPVDWEAVAADQAMTIALLKAELQEFANKEADALEVALTESGWMWDGDQWQRPAQQEPDLSMREPSAIRDRLIQAGWTPPSQQQEPVAFYVYKPTLPRGHLGNVSDGDLPWVYDQDPSSGFSARMLVAPVASPPAQRKPLTDEQIAEIAATPCAVAGSYVHTFARAIESAHGIGEKK